MSPGLPPDVKHADQLAALQEAYSTSLLPPQGRGYRRLRNAAQGRPSSQERYAEVHPLSEALLQTLAGLPIVRAETRDQRAERLAPEMQARPEAAQAFMQAVDDEAGPNPYAAGLESVGDAGRLKAKLQQVQQALRAEVLNVANYDPQRRLTQEGEDRLRKTLLYLKAIAGRLEAVGRQ